MNRDKLPTKAKERRLYDLHQNSSEDLKYKTFLSRIIEPLECELERSTNIETPLTGLDFGSGPGPTLHLLLRDIGYDVYNYDPLYAPDIALLERNWDFICATEVFEHLHHPNGVFKNLIGMLKPKGVIAIMTLLYSSKIDFKSWFYKNDPTHVGFFSKTSLEWMAKQFNLRLRIHDDRCITFKKL